MLTALLVVLRIVRRINVITHSILSTAAPNTGNVTTEEMVSNLIKRSKVPQVFTSQVQVERTDCSLLHYQCLQLEECRKQSFRGKKTQKKEKKGSIVRNGIINMNKYIFKNVIIPLNPE